MALLRQPAPNTLRKRVRQKWGGFVNRAQEKLLPPRHGRIIREETWGRGKINQVTWSSDGRAIVLASTTGLLFRDAATLQVIEDIPTEHALERIAYYEQNGTVVALSAQHIYKYQAHTGRQAEVIQLQNDILADAVLSPQEDLLAYISGPTVELFALSTPYELWQLPATAATPPNEIAFNAHGTYIVGIGDQTIDVWSLQTRELLPTLTLPNRTLARLHCVLDQQIVVSDTDQHLLIVDLFGRVPPRELPLSVLPNACIAPSPDGTRLLIAQGQLLTSFDLQSGVHKTLADDLSQPPLSVAFAPDGERVVVASESELSIRQKDTGQPLQYLSSLPLHEHAGSVCALAIAPNTMRVAAIWRDGQICQTDWGRLVHWSHWSGSQAIAASIAFSPDAHHVAYATNTAITLRNADTGTPCWSVEQGVSQSNGLLFSADNRHLISISQRAIHQWNVESGVLEHTTPLELERVYHVALSHNGQTIALARHQEIIAGTLDAPTAATPLCIKLDINSLGLSADGELLAIATTTRLQVWSLSSRMRLVDRELPAQRVLFSPDHRYLAVVSDATIQLLCPDQGVVIKTFTGHTDRVRTIAFSNDGRVLISGSYDGTIRVWTCE